MMATFAFGLVLVGAFVALLVLADSMLRGWATFHDLRKDLLADAALPASVPQVRSIARRICEERRAPRPTLARRAA